jgi:hypothetical protein
MAKGRKGRILDGVEFSLDFRAGSGSVGCERSILC